MKALWLGILFTGFTLIARAAEPAIRLDLGAGTGIDLLLVPAGEFTQGSPEEEAGRGTDENPRRIQLTKDFYISRTAVTRGQWERFIAETGYRTEAEEGSSGGYGWDGAALTQRRDFTWRNPGFPQDATHPVCLVTFPDVYQFCEWLEEKSGRGITLPTEAQWEYACRAVTSTPWHSGSETAAWHKGNSGNRTHPADSSPPNAWGLVIGGNVSEWCLDWYAPYDPETLTDPCQEDPSLSDKPRRILRGGSWNRDLKNTRSAARFRADPRSRNADIGFRIVCETEVIAPVTAAPMEEAAGPFPSIPSSAPSGLFPTSSLVVEHRDHWIPGWLCFLIPIALIAGIIRFATRRGSQPSPMRSRPMPPPMNRQQRGVRMVDNGFWIHSDWPVGTSIHLSYLVNGAMERQTLVYQPGSQGQFIFTGERPDSVTISGTGAQPPPLHSQPPPLHSRNSPSHRPPFSPSAY